MQAVINLSGEGTRLRPLSCDKCSGMLTVGDAPLAEKLVKNLKENNIKDIIIVTGYMSDYVKDYFKNGKEFGVNISYIPSEWADGTLKIHADMLEDEFIYISKTVYANIDFSQLVKFHKEKNAYATILTSKNAADGIVSDKQGRITRFEEKRMWSSLVSKNQGIGIYVLNCDIVRFMPSDTCFELSEGVFPSLVRAGKSIYSLSLDGAVENIQDISGFMRANFSFLDTIKKTTEKGIVIEKGARVDKGALLEAPCYVAEGAHVHKGAKIGAYTILGKDTVVLEGASIKRSIVGKSCRIGIETTLRGCILDNDVKVGNRAAIYEQAVIGSDTKIDDEARIKSFVKIWPEKTIDKGVTVSENIMWGQKKRSKLFEKGKICGIVNVDITPRFATMLGECAAMGFDGGDVGISTDGSPVGSMLRDAISAGLAGNGIAVKDFGEQPLPITRRAVAFYMLKGALCINVFEQGGEDRAEITLIGKDGLDIDDSMRLAMEDYFEKGDFLYPESKDIKECEYLFEYKLYYLKSLVGYKKKENSQKKILVSCSATWGRRLIASAMSDFSCHVSMYSPSVDGKVSSIQSFAGAVAKESFDIGFILDSKCEKLTIVLPDRVIDEETYEALTSLIVMKKHENAKIYVPVTASSVIEHLAEKYGSDVMRTHSAQSEIMRHMSGEEKYLQEQFIFRFDAVAAVIKIVDYLLENKTDITTLLNEIPPITMAKTFVEVSADEANKALGKISTLDGATDNAEGVKITFDKGWVVVIPDDEGEVFKVVSEGVNAEFARELCDFCVEKMLKQ